MPASNRLSFRCSDFCRPPAPPQHEVKVRIDRRKRKQSEGYASIILFVQLSLKDGALVWLNSNDGYGVAIYLMVDLEAEDGDTVIVSPTVAASLGCSWFGEACTDGRDMAQNGIQACENEPILASTVTLRPLGRPVPKRIIKNQLSTTAEFPSVGNETRLLSVGSLISVQDKSETFVFEVHSINGEYNNTICKMVYISSNNTEWKLEPYPFTEPIRRLPPHIEGMPHPSVARTRNALLLSVTSPPSQKILHVLGSRENHIDICVETAAGQLGMRCLQVRGLAAFAHSTGHTVTTGGLVDRLAGIKAALYLAHQYAPCVLHLIGLNEEVSAIDEPVRHMEEQRIWTALLSSLETAICTGVSSQRFAPPVLVVFSTNTPLNSGPWMQNLVFPTVMVPIPDELYARQLWRDDLTFDSTLLLGRTAVEISKIRKMYNTKNFNSSKESQAYLADLCFKLDSRKETLTTKIPTVRWEDVGGLAHVRTEVMDAIELPLRYPELFEGSNRSGILLYGPPGTGKTLVAKAVATECGLPFLSVKGPELLGSYVGESEANVRQIFETARVAAQRNKPAAAILFFDELDSLAPRRGGGGDKGGVMERVVSTLLSELDGRQTKGRVFIIGATNRPDLLDPSLLRPGRLDRLVFLGLAVTTEDRAKILAALIRKFKLDDDPMSISNNVVDSFSPNLSGADFSAIASGALMKSLQRLCVDADKELQGRQAGLATTKIELDEILDEWCDARLVPIVSKNDLLEAAKNVIPSVNKVELERYEGLRQEFSSDALRKAKDK